MTLLKRLVAFISLAGLTLVPVAGGTQGASPSLATLLARHAPILVLHPAERFGPVPVDGFLADSERDWVDALNRLKSDTQLRAKMGRAARQTVENEFSTANTAPRLAALLNEAAP